MTCGAGYGGMGGMGGGMGGMGYGGGGGEVINNYYGDGGGGMGGGGGAMDYGGAPCRALGETKLLLQCKPLSLSCVAAFTTIYAA